MSDKIIIEINDVVSDQIAKKIDAIDKMATSASKSIDMLNASIKSLKTESLTGLSKVLKDSSVQSNNLSQSILKLEINNQKLLKATNEASISNQRLVQQYERSQTAVINTAIAEERLRQQIEKGTLAIEKRNSILKSQPKLVSDTSSLDAYLGGQGVNQPAKDLKKNFIDRKSDRGLIIESEKLKIVQFQNEQEKIGLDVVKRKQDLKLKEVNTLNLQLGVESKITSENRNQLRIASERLKANSTARGALGNQAIGAVGTGINSAQISLIDRHNDSVKQAITLYRTLGIITRGTIIAGYTKQILESTDAFTLIKNRLNLVSTSLEHNERLYRNVAVIANETRTPVEELAKSFVRFDYALKGLGASQTESLQFTKTIAQQISISGLAVQEQSSALLQLSQALNKGKLDGDEFRTVMETLPALATAIAKTMGVARGELIRLAPEGKITASIIRDAMKLVAEDTDKAFKNLTPTIGQGFTVISNSTIDLIGNVKEFTGATEIMGETLIFVGENLKLFASIGAGVAIASLVNYTKNIQVATTATKLFNLAISTNPVLLAAGALGTLTTAVILYRDEIKVAGQENLTLGDSFTAFNSTLNPFAKNIEKVTEDIKNLNEDSLWENIKEAAVVGLGNLPRDMALFMAYFLDPRVDENNIFYKIIENEEKIQNARTESIKKATEEENSYKKFTQELKNNENATNLLKKAKEDLDKNRTRERTAEENIKLAEQTEKFYDDQIVRLRNYTGKDKAIREESFRVANELELLKFNLSAKIKNPEGAKRYNDDMELQKTILADLNLETKDYINTVRVANDLLEKRKITEEQYRQITNKTSLGQKKVAVDEFLALKMQNSEYETQREEIKKTYQEKINLIKENPVSIFGTTDEAKAQIETLTDLMIRDLNIISETKSQLSQKDIDMFEETKKATEELTKLQLDKLQAIEDKKKEDYLNSIKRRDEEDAFYKKNKNFGMDTEDPFERIKKQIAAAEETKDKLISIAQQRYTIEGKLNEGGQKQIFEITSNYTKKRNALENELASRRLDIYANMFGSLTGLANVFAQEGKKGAKEMFYISQGLALAQATVSTASSIASGLATPPSPNYAAAIAAGIAGATQIATITGTTIQGFARGVVNLGGTGTGTSDSNVYALSRGESVLTANATRKHGADLERMNRGLEPSYTKNQVGGNVIVNIHNNGNNEIRQETSYAPDGSKQLDIFVDQIETKLAQKYADGNGKLAKAIDGKRLRNY